MSIKIFLSLTLLIIPISCVQIPFIRNAIFVPVSNSNSTIITNSTCIQCLCNASSSNLILNCFFNNTCQFFFNFPLRYNIQQLTNASLYFPQGIFPNASQCCMPNLTDLLYKIQTATPIYGSVLGSRCLALDNHGYVVTLSQTNSSIVRFNSTTMALIDNTIGLFSGPTNLKYYNEAYYVGSNNYILVINSNNLTIQNNITSVNINAPRDMMFLNNGNIFVAVSTGNSLYIFFNQSSNLSTNYYPMYQQQLNYIYPHGLVYINDTFFYGTSWNNNTVYSYTAVQNSTQWNQNSTQWNQNLVINAAPWAPTASGNHITIDECGRFWYSLGNYGLVIFDSQGVFLANMTIAVNSSIFDTIITDNYIFYLSDTGLQRIIRIDPNIQC